MADIYLTNSLTNKKEKFIPINPPKVGMYSCGPTVYDYSSIGNFRTYSMADILLRVLEFNGFEVTYIMNLTDVGHLTGDNLGDADTGEDRVEKAARSQGKTAWEISRFYTDAFLKDFKKLNLKEPKKFTKATEHIEEQIALIEKLEKLGFTYKTSDGVYFDTVAFEKKTGKKYGRLSTLDKIKEGSRVKVNLEKKNPRDFALWKFSKKPGVRQMEWESPWGLGFPGWHIECSAMSMKYLGESFDIHVGGEDLRSIHHPNEIAQSEAATGKPFVRYWVHVAFLNVEGKKMSKSLGNFFTVADIEKKGFEPLALRYLYLSAHYRDPLNFTWEALFSAQNALDKIRNLVSLAKRETKRTVLSSEKREKVDDFRTKFTKAVNDDLDTPLALALLWKMMKSNIPSEDKYDLALTFDEVLGLDLAKTSVFEEKIPDSVQKLVDKREILRKEGRFKQADELRKQIERLGFLVEDAPEGVRVKKRRDFGV